MKNKLKISKVKKL